MLSILLLQATDAPPDVKSGAAQLISQAFILVLTPVLVWLFKSKVLTAIPRALVPILAVCTGTLLTYVTSLVTGGTFDPTVGAVLGGLGVTLREFVNTINEHGIS